MSRLEKLFVWSAKDDAISEHQFRRAESIADCVDVVFLCENNQTHKLVLKRREKFEACSRTLHSVLDTIYSLSESTPWKEIDLIHYLCRKTPKHISQLYFSPQRYPFLLKMCKSKFKVIPVKVSYFYESHRRKRVRSINENSDAQERVLKRIARHIKKYHKGESRDRRVRDNDWSTNKNILYDSDESIIYHDFDMSV